MRKAILGLKVSCKKQIAYFLFSVAIGDIVIYFIEKGTPLILENLRAIKVVLIMVETLATRVWNL